MQNKTFEQLLTMINNACNSVFYSGAKDIKETVVKCATKIYIEQMRNEND